MGWVNGWDPTKPAPSDKAKQGDDEIRAFKLAMAERLGSFTDFPNGNGSQLSLLAGTVGTAQIVDGAVLLAKLDPTILQASNIAAGIFPAGDFEFQRGVRVGTRHHLGFDPTAGFFAVNGFYDSVGVAYNRGDISGSSLFLSLVDKPAIGAGNLAMRLSYALAGANPIGAFVDLLSVYTDGKVEARGDLRTRSGNLRVVNDPTNAGTGAEFRIAAEVSGTGLFFNMSNAGARLDNTKPAFGIFLTGGSALELLNIDSAGASAPVLIQSAYLQVSSLLVSGVQVVGARRTGWIAPTSALSRASFDAATVTLQQLGQRVAAIITDLGATSGHGLLDA